jgi:hypothetical protein
MSDISTRYRSKIRSMTDFVIRIPAGVLAVLLSLYLVGAIPGEAVGQSQKKVVLLVQFPKLENENQKVTTALEWFKANMPADLQTEFNKMHTEVLTSNLNPYVFIPPGQSIFDRLSIRAHELKVKDELLKNTEMRNYFKDQAIDYLIVTQLEILPFGNIWEFRWVFTKFSGDFFELSSGYHHQSFVDYSDLYNFFIETPQKMASDFKNSFGADAIPAGGTATVPGPEAKKRAKIIVTSCFWHSVADTRRKEILDRLQVQLPSALAKDLEDSEVLKDYEVIPFSYPRRCVSVTDNLEQEIISIQGADFIISAHMDMEESMNWIHFFLRCRSAKDFSLKTFEMKYRKRSNYAAKVVSKYVAEEICSQWGSIEK